ncbi:MAG: 2Fe-2S iron-sulfur cluster-binding protein [Azonexus sp.]
MNKITISFPGTHFSDVEIPVGDSLSLHLNASNSPLLFGCRAGLCGTCVIEVELSGEAAAEATSDDEREVLAIYAPDRPHARLACQMRATGSIKVRRFES